VHIECAFSNNKKVFFAYVKAILNHRFLYDFFLPPMKRSTLYALAIPLLILTACKSTSKPIDGSTSSLSAVSSVAIQETKNVTYQGILQAAGASIFMEGSHKLQLEDGRFIMLEGESDNLSQYINMKVELFGAVRPTVEAGGMIMRVEKVTSLEVSSNNSEGTTSSEAQNTSLAFTGANVVYTGSLQNSAIGSCSLQLRGKNTSVILTNFEQCALYGTKTVEVTGKLGSVEGGKDNILWVTSIHEVQIFSSAAAISSRAPVESSSRAISSATASSIAPIISSISIATSSAAYESSTELTDKAAIMAKDNMSAGFWTQQYCSKTAGYCLSIHKNWYFKSFGAISATLWHLEVGPQEINNIGEGPLAVNLVSGTVESAGATDGQVKTANGVVIGYKAWTDNRHFEIRGPSNLQTAITFMVSNLKAN
jgi:hypothetical protein